ncbi:unnamed protein product [Trifolium pratense]|uniref:Uncharacterized protein n=1 Tax=Trifolium pratense TaxID=57577 RepID=A0ACB0JX69_TRIPR|nr:unnamed protein product [Trifolium pratense]
MNNFSDDILTHIISFLPFKQAIRTSILSKRWLPLCQSLSVLTFDDSRVKNTNDWILFCRQIDQVMFSPRSHQVTLKSFHLKCRSKLWKTKAECFSFNKWIEEAKRRRIEELNLTLLFDIPLIPNIFCCCKTLVILKLRRIRVATNMIDCSVDLPLLKTLYLFDISFKHMNDFMKLLSGCPKLENLETSYVNGVKDDGGYFKPLSNLIKASISLFEVPFRAVYNVKTLTIFELGRNLGNEGTNSYYKALPVFKNLTKLQLEWIQGTHDWDEVVKMLQNCPTLQTLEIEKCRQKSTTIEDWKYPDHVPECVSSHLTTCIIMNYEAVEADFRFATYILQNAMLLLVMKIRSYLNSNPMASPQFLEDLTSCPRISPTCKLSLL